MPHLGLRARAFRPPQTLPRINYQHPIAQDLAVFTAPALDQGRPLGAPTAISRGGGKHGVVASFNGTSTLLTMNAGVIRDGWVTIASWHRKRPFVSGWEYIAGSNYDGVSEPFQLRYYNDLFSAGTWNGSQGTLADVNVSTIPNGEDVLGYGIYPPGTGAWNTPECGIYRANGTLHGRTVSASGPVPSRASFRWYVGAGANALTPWRFYGGQMYWFAAWNRALSAAELQRLAIEPWVLTRPRSTHYFMPASSGGGDLAGTGAGSAVATATLSTAIQASGTASGSAGASAGLTTAIPLQVSASAVATAQGGLSTSIRFSGAALAAAAASAALSSGIPLQGTSGAAALGQATLTTQIPLNGMGAGAATAVGDLTGGAGSAQLAGTAQVTAAAAGNLSSQIPLQGAAVSVSAANGVLTVAIVLDGDALAVAIAQGGLTAAIALRGVATGAASAQAGLAGTQAIRIVAMTFALAARAAGFGFSRRQAEVALAQRAARFELQS